MSTHLLERPAPIDPRIRARRIEVQRDAGRRRLQRLVELGLVVAVALAFAGALRSPLLDVDRVTVSGTDRLPPEAVVAAAGVTPGDQLVDLDVGAAAEQVAALAWVEHVEVHRSLGGTVAIRVVERTPAAVVAGDGTAVLVDESGAALGPVDEVDDVAGLVRVAGPALVPGDVVEGELAEAVAVAARLGTIGSGSVEEVRVGPGGELRVALAAGGEARLGDTSRLDAKLVALHAVLEQVDLRCLAELDLRLPGNPVLTRGEPCP